MQRAPTLREEEVSRQKLSEAEIRSRLELVPAWRHVDGKLHRELVFETFVDAFGFMTRVALLAERLDHHPAWSNVYNRVEIDLMTHDAGALTELDFELARKIDTLVVR